MRNLNHDNSLYPALTVLTKLKDAKFEAYFDILLYLHQEEKNDMIKSPHDHVLSGVPGLNTPSSES